MRVKSLCISHFWVLTSLPGELSWTHCNDYYQYQLLRSSVSQKRPAASILLDGQVALNTHFLEPGLFFRLTNGQLTKIGPAAYTYDGLAPNHAAVGQPGNCVGEEWLDDRLSYDNAILKLWDGVKWTTSSGFTIDDATGDFFLDRDMTVNRLNCKELLVDSEFRLSHDLTANGNCTINIGKELERFNAGWFCTLDVLTDLYFGNYVSGPSGVFSEDVTTKDLTAVGDVAIGTELEDTLLVKSTSSFESSLAVKMGLTAYGDVALGDPLETCDKSLTVHNVSTFHCPATFKDSVVFEKDVSFKDIVTFDKQPEIPSLTDLVLLGDTVIGDGCSTSTLDIKAATTLRCQTTFIDTITVHQKIIPNLDSTVDLGSEARRFANVYTGDLHLKNDRGDWTVIEEEDYLSLRNNQTGKTFRLVMEEV